MAKFRRSGRRISLIAALVIPVAVFMLCFASCTYGGGSATTAKKIDFLALELSALEEYVEIGQYKELRISRGERSRGEAVWEEILKGSQVVSYPEEHVYYYVGQLRTQYSYYAEQAGISYEEMLSQLGADEGSILKEAKELTREDIIYAIVVKKESIALTDAEKQALFSKYVDKYVSEYGYTKEYVEENMSEEIYGSMLYDKTTEFLIVSNDFE